MPKHILMEEIHLSVSAPAGLSEAQFRAMARTLRSGRFESCLRNAVLDVFRRFRSLKRARLSVNR